METKEIKTDCDCLKETAKLIIDKISSKETNPKGYKIIQGDWEHKSWYPKVRLYSNYIILETVFEKKDGTTSKPRKEHVAIYYSYCPFCGKKYED